MNFSKNIINLAGAARSIDASMMPTALAEDTYNEDIFALNDTILLTTRHLAKMDIAISSIFTNFSPSFLSTLLNTPVSSVEKVTHSSVLMFSLKKTEHPTLDKFFGCSSIQARKIKSHQKSMFYLIREMARYDIASAQLIAGLTINELIAIANKSNVDISQTVDENNFIYAYRGSEQMLLQSFKMPDSNNAKMIALSKLLLSNAII